MKIGFDVSVYCVRVECGCGRRRKNNEVRIHVRLVRVAYNFNIQYSREQDD